jgi:hypothetical protein
MIVARDLRHLLRLFIADHPVDSLIRSSTGHTSCLHTSTSTVRTHPHTSDIEFILSCLRGMISILGLPTPFLAIDVTEARQEDREM